MRRKKDCGESVFQSVAIIAHLGGLHKSLLYTEILVLCACEQYSALQYSTLLQVWRLFSVEGGGFSVRVRFAFYIVSEELGCIHIRYTDN